MAKEIINMVFQGLFLIGMIWAMIAEDVPAEIMCGVFYLESRQSVIHEGK